ncbi:Protein of unknown function [Eubacterium oxidoreducens]|uniref:DUF3810 domain-containing protein n=2 Tax=Eubacterium oxidoreducens TaxID=1732 RepID=A0A1G6AAM1_EUBOX|nr:Protein of unknown function [Eubacterium oxidoreducens]
MIVLAVTIILLHVLAISERFVNVYHHVIYIRIAEYYGGIMGKVPINVGEIMMYCAAGFLILELVLVILLLFWRAKSKYRRWVVSYSKALLLGAAVVVLIYTLNWSIPFRYSIDLGEETVTKYTLGDLQKLRSDIVEMLNQAAEEIGRDEDGNIVYEEDVDEQVIAALKGISDEFEYLDGSYPVMKESYCSDVLEWMNIAGYTYPYTMEVTYNKYTMSLYYPSLLAHEMSHHKGYYKEDDANFLSEIACMKSECPYLVYSGCLDAYYYVDNAYKEALFSYLDEEEATTIWQQRELASALVGEDLTKDRKAAQEAYNADEHAAQSFSSAAQSVSEVGWDVQSDVLEEDCYEGVVGLLLQYDWK